MLLYSLIDSDSATAHEHPQWDEQIQPAILDGTLSRDYLLGALNWTARQFSAAVTNELHQNFVSYLGHLDRSAAGGAEG